MGASLIPTPRETRTSIASSSEIPRTGSLLFRAGRYGEAAAFFEEQLRVSTAKGDDRASIVWLNDLAGCYFATYQYGDAMRRYLEARRLAETAGSWEYVAALSANLSSLYLQSGEIDAAREAAEAAIRSLRRVRSSPYYPHLLIQLGRVDFRRGDAQQGMADYQAGIEAAAQQGDWATQAKGWDHLGWELLLRRDLTGAERALVEAFRLRRMNGNREVHLSYPKLGLLRLMQGDFRTASTFLNLAVEASRREPSLMPLWSVYHHRGELALAQGRLADAWSDFRTALDLARRWRLEVLPAEAVRNSAAVGLQELCASVVEAGHRLSIKDRRPQLARETFEAAEESRAWSLRASLDETGELQQKLPASYWETLARLQRIEVALLEKGDAGARRNAGLLRARLTEMEAEAGLAIRARRSQDQTRPAGRLLAEVESRLRPDETLWSFHLAEPESNLWIVSRQGLGVERLAAGSRLRAIADRFRSAIERRAPEADGLGERLYGELFGKAPALAAAKPHWILALDEPMFGIPYAALVCGRAAHRPVYLAERHSVRIVPSALHVAEPASIKRGSGFLGIGDPIYNIADARWPGQRPAGQPARRQVLNLVPVVRAEMAAASALQFARLAGGARELEACARSFAGSPILLTGAAASKERLRQALTADPAVVHFAVHVLVSEPRPQRIVLALSLRPDGANDLLTPREIGGWRYDLGLVALSACSSGVNGELDEPRGIRLATRYSPLHDYTDSTELRGAGLLGLSRAWLTAGARAVIASHWATPDASGELFRNLYPHLAGDNDSGWARRAAVALAAAQRATLRSPGWQAQPAYWAAYYVIGKD